MDHATDAAGSGCGLGFGKSNDLAFSCPSVSASFDRRQTATLVTDSSACEEADLVSAGGDPHVNNATGEKFDLWNTGRFSFVLIPKDVQPESMAELLTCHRERGALWWGEVCFPLSCRTCRSLGYWVMVTKIWCVEILLVEQLPSASVSMAGAFKTIDVPVVRQGQVPTVQAVQNTVEVPHVRFLDRVVDVPLVMQRQVPMPVDAARTSSGAHR